MSEQSTHGVRCDQLLGQDDDCCGPEEVCGAPAAWTHVESGLSLCAKCESSARRWNTGGFWIVGTAQVSYPEGWSEIEGVGEDADEQGTTIEVVHVGGGLVVDDSLVIDT